MNKQQMDILMILLSQKYINQRILAEQTGYSLGTINASLKELVRLGYLDDYMNPTKKIRQEAEQKKPKRAIILAAGFGMRMVPINVEFPKGLIEIKGEPLIERLIKQLHAVEIKKIYIVVGFMKEKYEYLIDEFGVELVVNPEYAKKNNLFSLKRVSSMLTNAYIIPCDIWCKQNPFREYELYSWYMVSNLMNQESAIRVNRKMELVNVTEEQLGNVMVGISYLVKEDAEGVRQRVQKLCMDRENDGAFWEKALYEKRRMIVSARVVRDEDVLEINTYEQLREIEGNSSQLKNDAIQDICSTFGVTMDEISDIQILKKGMTNRSFLFWCKGKKYIMRIPGEGTEQLIERKKEATVYRIVSGRNLCDDIVYMNVDKGYKITEYWEKARVCNPTNSADLEKAMECLRQFHDLKLRVEHKFDLFGQIQFYEKLWNGEQSVYRDYEKTKENVFSLKEYIDKHAGEEFLTHIDAVPDNFLFLKEGGIRLIDWEYAGMQDPHVDIAMFAIYSLYSRKQIDQLIDIYFCGKCDIETRIKIYCYVAVCGLLWSNWCEYKKQLGVEFGEYSLKQYRYAKEYYKIVREELRELEK